jgi:hypothetical protein
MIVVDVVGTIIDIAYVVQFELAGEQPETEVSVPLHPRS